MRNGKLGIWLFLASEVMLFGALFSSYIILRTGSIEWPHGELSVWLGAINTVILISSSVTMVHGLGDVEAERLGEAPAVPDRDVRAGWYLPREQVLRVPRALRRG